MNCREAQELFEDAIDHALSGRRKRVFDLHLSHCPDCHRLYERDVREHASLFRAFNDPWQESRLPSHARMTERLLSARRAPRGLDRVFRLPRWARWGAVASVVVSLGLAAAQVERILTKASDVRPGDEMPAPVTERAQEDVGNVVPSAGGGTVETISEDTCVNVKRENNMKIATVASIATAALMGGMPVSGGTTGASATVTSAEAGGTARDAHLVACYTFDDAANPLAAEVGAAATVVDYSSAGVNVVEGLGGCALVTDEAVTNGLDAGSGALTIPRGQALRIAHNVSTSATGPWCVSMRIYLPENNTETAYNTLFDTFQSGEGDGAICIKKSNESDYAIGGGANTDNNAWGYYSISKDAWHVVTLSMKAANVRLFVDGELLVSRATSLTQMRGGRLNLKDRPFLFLSGDDNGEDAPLHFDWVKVYDTAEPDEVFRPEVDRPELLAHYSFDNAADPLAATVGTAATVVNYSKNSVTEVEGLGGCALVSDEAVTSGLDAGSGALMIPRGQALRIAHNVSTSTTEPWCIAMRVYLPENNTETPYNSLFETYQSGDGDGAICIKKFSASSYSIGGGADDATSWGYVPIAVNAWHVIVLSLDNYRIRLFIDGQLCVSKDCSLSAGRIDRLNLKDRPFLFLSGDDSGEDAPLYFDWVKIYGTSAPGDLITKTALWTGAGDRSNPADALNWTVLEDDRTIVGGVPDETTEIVVSGSTDLNVPAGTSVSCARVRLDGDVTLTAGADWRGFGVAPWCGFGVINLNGHRLDVASLKRTDARFGVIKNDGAAPEPPAELHIDIPSGTEEWNRAFGINGNIQLVKDGEGTYVPCVEDVTYSGGTEVICGTLKCGTSPLAQACGEWGTTIGVGKDAVFDLWGRSHLQNYVVRLDGGTLTSTRNLYIGSHDWILGNLVLTADSRLVFADFGKNVNVSHDVKVANASVWDLGGHVLDIDFAGYDPDFYTSQDTAPASKLTLVNGTIRTQGLGWFHDYGILGGESGGLDLDNHLRLQVADAESFSDIHDFTVRTTSANVTSIGRLRIWGTFAPLSDYCFKVELQDGASLDLSTFSSEWPILFKNGCSASFADEANITLKLGDRRFSKATRVVAWDSMPSNASTLRFTAQTSYPNGYSVSVQSSGVYILPGGLMVIIR